MTCLASITSSVLASASRHETIYRGRSTVWHAWGHGRPLVLLHGGSGSWMHWFRNVVPLADAGYRVLVPDMPGFGESDVSLLGGEDAPGIIAPLWDGLTQLVREPVPIVGFSFGAMVAVMMTDSISESVQQLVLLAPPGLGLREEGARLVQWRSLPEGSPRDVAHRYNLTVRMLHQEASVDDAAVAIHGANLERDRMRFRRMHQTDIVLQALPRLNCRVDFIFGAQDALYKSQLDEAERLCMLAPSLHSFGLISGAGHWVQYEQPERTNDELIRLLM